jgi:hypothetical protein
MLDFLIWRRQADKLGIQLNREGINKEIERATLRLFSNSDSHAIESQLARDQAFSSELLVHVLGEEFRVRLAKKAFLGPDPVTPEDFWNYYQEKRTETQVGVLPVPVRQKVFLDKVGTPSEGDLQELFNKYKNKEAAPGQADPGFKQPQRIDVAWVGARAGLPYYRQQAAQLARVLQAASWIAAAGGNQRAAGSPAAASAVETALPLLLDTRLILRYESERRTNPTKFEAPSWSSWDLKLHDSSVNQPLVPGMRTVSSALAATPWQGPAALGTIVSHQVGSAVAREFRDRVALASNPLVLTGAGPSPLAALALVSTVTPKSAQERYYPFAHMRDFLTEEVQESLAHQLIIADMKAFKAELEKKAKDPEAARKYVAETVQRFGWDHGSMGQPRDRYTISDAEALRPLKAAVTRGAADARSFTAQLNGLFTSSTLHTPQEWPSDFSQRKPDDNFSWTTDPECFLYWKTRDERAYVPDSLAKVRDQVVEAWRFLHARKLAEAEANRLQDAVLQTKGDVQKLKDLGKQFSAVGKYEDLGPIAPLLPSEFSSFMTGSTGRREYHPYRVPEDKIPYAGAEFAAKLLGLKAVGKTTVLSNQPEDTWYVVTVVKQTPPSSADFYITYMDSVPGKPPPAIQDMLFSDFEAERQREYQDKILRQLRTDANLTLNPETAKEERDRNRPEDERGAPPEPLD